MNWSKANRDDSFMTSLVGEVETTYDRLVEVFGEPHLTAKDSSDGKITAEWIVSFNGDVATIYDYKERQTPKGSYRWHIGGHKRSVVAKVEALVAA